LSNYTFSPFKFKTIWIISMSNALYISPRFTMCSTQNWSGILSQHLTKTQNPFFQEKEKRTNCKDLGVGQNLTEFVKISILRSFVYLFFISSFKKENSSFTQREQHRWFKLPHPLFGIHKVDNRVTLRITHVSNYIPIVKWHCLLHKK
jgi:hypothetical protein